MTVRMTIRINSATDKQQRKPYIPTIVDVEASGFSSHSYPVEIGVALPNGDRYCALIAPDASWVHWDSEAEALHGLSRARISAIGKTPELVAQELNQLLRGKTLYSDGWSVDYPWIRTLFHTGREEMEFSVSALEMILSEQDIEAWDSTKRMIRDKMAARRHRASWDARVIQETYVELQLRKQRRLFASSEGAQVG